MYFRFLYDSVWWLIPYRAKQQMNTRFNMKNSFPIFCFVFLSISFFFHFLLSLHKYYFTYSFIYTLWWLVLRKFTLLFCWLKRWKCCCCCSCFFFFFGFVAVVVVYCVIHFISFDAFYSFHQLLIFLIESFTIDWSEMLKKIERQRRCEKKW